MQTMKKSTLYYLYIFCCTIFVYQALATLLNLRPPHGSYLFTVTGIITIIGSIVYSAENEGMDFLKKTLRNSYRTFRAILFCIAAIYALPATYTEPGHHTYLADLQNADLGFCVQAIGIISLLGGILFSVFPWGKWLEKPRRLLASLP